MTRDLKAKLERVLVQIVLRRNISVSTCQASRDAKNHLGTFLIVERLIYLLSNHDIEMQSSDFRSIDNADKQLIIINLDVLTLEKLPKSIKE